MDHENDPIVIQRRIDNSTNFNRNWADYKSGFGQPNGNMWIGLENLHKVAAPGKRAMLEITMTHRSYPNQVFYANYNTFEVENEANWYRLKLKGYSGNAGDSMAYNNGMKFTTSDKDNDRASWKCGERYQGGWWFNACHSAFLNGAYPTEQSTEAKFMSWKGIDGYFGNVLSSEMRIKYHKEIC